MCSYFNTYNGLAAVTFQFSRIGNDLSAAQLLMDLDGYRDIGKYIDVLPTEFDPECLLADKWFVVCHARLFLKLGGLEKEATLTSYLHLKNSYRKSCSVRFCQVYDLHLNSLAQQFANNRE